MAETSGIIKVTWTEFFERSLIPTKDVLSAAFLDHWGNEVWEPNDDDRTAAAKLHTEIVSRVTTQKLGYLDGVEKAALESVYSLFGKTRKIAEKNPLCRHFDAIAWDVLNSHVRPFTAKWHRASEIGVLSALDATDEFRTELAAIQPVLQRFDDLLVQLRDTHRSPRASSSIANDREEQIRREMDSTLNWGIPEPVGGIPPPTALAINNAEHAAVRARRVHYGISEDKPHAVALALSGGGIRSATFSLGVLVALARRDVLKQFDYLSTVSGGGYIGSFLSAFLNSPEKAAEPSIGLRPEELPFRRDEGEAAALRHLRHHSKYLGTGSLWGRLTMVCAQLYGLFLNGLAIVFLATVVVVIERFVRGLPWLQGRWDSAMLVAVGVLALGTVSALVAMRIRGGFQRHADTLVVIPTILVLALLAWRGLNYNHAWFHRLASIGPHRWPLISGKMWLVITGAIPAVPVQRHR